MRFRFQLYIFITVSSHNRHITQYI
uniref:Uncharacterized protein n=1 Tax=Anguilla anguilla TaxID=7936 RepID=A0A0E9SRB1_ANGAN